MTFYCQDYRIKCLSFIHVGVCWGVIFGEKNLPTRLTLGVECILPINGQLCNYLKLGIRENTSPYRCNFFCVGVSQIVRYMQYS